MPNFKTNMTEWDGAYAPPRTVTAKDSEGWGALAEKLVPGMIEAAGRGYANAKGSNIQGLETTAVEAQEAVTQFEQEVPFTDDPSNTPDQRAQIEDMRNAALRKFGTNDKKIQALVTAGKISSLEANARRHQLIQDNLSNPVLAMFKDDFLEAAKPFTGGTGKLAEQYFGAYMPTEEERAKVAAIDVILEDRAKEEADVAGRMRMGMTEQRARESYAADRAHAAKVAKAEEDYKMRTYSSSESYVAAQDVVQLFANEVGGGVAQIVMSGQKLSPDQISQMSGQLETAKQQYIKKLDVYKNTMTSTDYRALVESFDGMVKDYNTMLSSRDGVQFAMDAYNLTITKAKAGEAQDDMFLRKNLGLIYTITKDNPTLGAVVVGAASGDIGAQYKMKHNVLAQNLLSISGFKPDKEDIPGVMEKMRRGEKNFNFKESLSFMSAIYNQGSQGVKAEMELNKAYPEEHMAMMRELMSQPASTLDQYRTEDWKIAAKTPEGAKVMATALKARMYNARVLQAPQGEIPKTQIIMEPAQMIRDDQGQEVMGTPTYKFNVPLSQPVKKSLYDSYVLLKENPAVMKELGVSTPEEFISNYFSESALGQARPR